MRPRNLLCLSVLLFVLVRVAVAEDAASWPTLDVTQLSHQTLHPAEFAVTDRVGDRQHAAELEYRPLIATQTNRGITADVHWVRVRLVNRSDQPRHWVLHHETSYLDHLGIFHRDSGGDWNETSLSDREPFHHRPVNHRVLAFAHETPAEGHTDLYLRLHFSKADALSLTLFLTEHALFRERTNAENLVQGAYFGLSATLMLIALVFARVVRERVYIHYAAYLALNMLMWAMLHGYSYQYLWPNSVFWQNEGFHIVYLATIIVALEFCRSFLDTATCQPRINRLILVAQGIMVAGIGLRFAGLDQPILILAFSCVALVALIPILSMMSYRRGMRYARWFGLAWLIYGLGLFLSTLSATSTWLGWGMTPLFYAQAFSVMVTLCLLLALGERLLSWDKDRQLAHKLANQDPLTGLGNRRALEAALETLRHRIKANGIPAFLIMIDLDHFKDINDHFGHEAGDQVLRDFADLLRNQSRPDDFSIRLGGEEFALLIQVANAEQAMEVAERIRKEFARHPSFHDDRRIDHTLSAGVTQIAAGARQGADKELMAQADQALYEAKAGGRNLTLLFDDQRAAQPSG